MRSYSQIYKDLSDSLTSASWEKLKNSLLGRELLSFGARVIQQNDVAANAYSDAFDYQSADKRSLISLSHTQDIGISFIRPSFITLYLERTQSIIAKPFEIKYSVGNTTFYNIDYVSLPGEVTLYNGTVRCYSTNSTIQNYPSFGNIPSTKSGTAITLDNPTMDGVSLGSAMPDSVFVFSNIGMFSLATPLSYPTNSFRLYTLYDGTLAVWIPNTSDAEAPYWTNGIDLDDNKLEIYWLEPDTQDVDSNGVITTTVPIAGVTIGSVVNALRGEESLDYARSFFRKKYLQNNVIASEKQIKDYSLSFSYVQDCSIDALNNVITVYIKPSPDYNSAPETYDDISSKLDLYGSLLTLHKAVKANKLDFKLYVKADGIESVTTDIASYLQELLAYNKLPFNYQLNVALLATELQSEFGIPFQVYIEQTVTGAIENSMQLAFLPKESTVKFYNSGALVAVDSMGIIYGAAATTSQALQYKNYFPCKGSTTKNLSLVSDYLYCYSESDNLSPMILLPQGSNISFRAPVETGSNLWGSTVSQSNGFVFVCNGSDIKLFSKEQVSPVFNFQSNVRPLSVLSSRYVQEMQAGTVQFAYSSGILLAVIWDDSLGTLSVEYNTISGGGETEYFVAEVPYTPTTAATFEVLAVNVSSGNLHILTNEKCISILDVFSSAYSYLVSEYNIQSLGTILAASSNESNTITLLYSTSGANPQVKYLVASGIAVKKQSSGNFLASVELVNAVDVLDGTNQVVYNSDYKYGCGASSNFWYVATYDGTNTSLFTSNADTASTTASSYLVSPVGSVDYNTGNIEHSIAATDKLQYLSTSIPSLEKSTFLNYDGVVFDLNSNDA